MLHMNYNYEFLRVNIVFVLINFGFSLFLTLFCSYLSTNSFMEFDIENMEHLRKISLPNHL